MRQTRRIILWGAPALLGILAILSIVGAFLGAQRAQKFFSSTPLAVFWCVLAASLVVSLFMFKRLRRSPELLVLHVGPLLVLLGGMYGSEAAHKLRSSLSWFDKVESGYMVIHEGNSSSRLLGQDLSEEVGTLPFRLKLRDFKIEHYPPEEERWQLVVLLPPTNEEGDDKTAAGQGGEQHTHAEPFQKMLEWELGQATEIPHTNARVEVLDYLPHARPVFGEHEKAQLTVVTEGGVKKSVAAEVGQELSLEEPQVALRVVKVFSNLQVVGAGEDREVVDMPGEGVNPAVKLEVERPDGETRHVHIMPRFPIHGQILQGITVDYEEPEALRAESDPDSAVPAMKVRVNRGDDELTRWLIVEENADHVGISLSPLWPDQKEGTVARQLFLARPASMPKDYKSELVVMEEGQAVAEKTIEVNDPLHYGGFHFYQSSYDKQNQRYTILMVKSDSGLWVVYAGFFLLVLGTFWWCWAEPVKSFIEQRK